MRRAEDDLADRRALVVDVARRRDESRVVERVGAAERHLLLRREEELDPRVLPTLVERRGAPLRASTTTAALLSEPRIVPAALRTMPSSPTTGSIAASGGTVSVCAHRKIGVPCAPFVGGMRQ